MGKRWTEDDDATLRKYYPIESPEQVARRVGRSKATTTKRAGVLGVKSKPKPKRKQNARTIRVAMTDPGFNPIERLAVCQRWSVMT